MKNKLILAFCVIFVFAYPSFLEACTCVKGESALSQISISGAANLETDDCHQACANLGATFYKINPSNYYWDDVTKQSNPKQCECYNNESKASRSGSFKSISDEKACNNKCAQNNAKQYSFGGGNLKVIVKPSDNDAASTGTFVYKPMEEIPGFGRPTDFPGYVMAIYNFGLWAIGICALLMISIGGYMYLTSAGNTSQTGKAKGVITDAIVGLALALVSWLLLYTINPDLVKIAPLTPLPGAPGTGAAGVPGTGGGPSGTTKGYAAACPNISSTTPINYAKAALDKKISVSSSCDKFDFSNDLGVDPKVLRTIAQLESNCGANKGPSAYACGLMQLRPETAGVTCQELMSNDKLSIELAAKYVSSALNSNCVANAENKQAAIFAGYNSGYGCGTKACSPKHALCSSSDCSGALAFECCKDPGGLDESINYAWNGVGILNKLK